MRQRVGRPVNGAPPVVRFDVLVAVDETTVDPRQSEPARPTEAQIDQVRRWFIRHGAQCHDTGFGVACTMPRARAAALFGGDLQPGEQVDPPAAIAHLVDQVTVPVEPELF